MSAAWLSRLERELGAEALSTFRERDGARELPCAAPASAEGFAAALAVAREAGLKVLPTGLGSKRGWCRPAERVDLALSTRRFAGLVCYEPGDGTVSARAGTTMADLAAAVAAGGHHLTPDVPRPGAATLGGVLAAGQSGFDRLRYGPARNALLGAKVLLSDGRTAKSGGQLVKNVTGYDLHRLYCGSHGTLCVLLEAALRLFPLPEEHAVLRVACADRGAALAGAHGVLALPARHVAVWCHDFDGPWTLAVALAGRREVVRHEAELVARALPAAQRCDGAEARALAAGERDRLLAGGWPALELCARRTDLEPALAHVLRAARTLGLTPRTLAHPGVAQAFVRLEGLEVETAEALHASLADLTGLTGLTGSLGLRARAVWRSLPDGAPAHLLGEPMPGLALMRALRSALDPEGRFAAGRLHGGL